MILRSREQLKDQLRIQLHFLAKMCELYDLGDYMFAQAMSVTLRIIFYDPVPRNPGKSKKGKVSPGKRKGTSISLIKQLHGEGKLLADTCSVAEDIDPDRLFFAHGCQVYDDKPLMPKLDLAPPRGLVKVDKWWNQLIFVTKMFRYTRRDAVLEIANANGGGHVDPEYSESYEFLEEKFLSYVAKFKDSEILCPIQGSHQLMIRQMAFEVLSSPEVVKLAEFPPGSEELYRIGAGASVFRKRVDVSESALSDLVPMNPPIRFTVFEELPKRNLGESEQE